MSYTPPAGNAVELVFLGVLPVIPGNAVNLNFIAPIGQNTPADIAFTTADVTISVVVYQPITADVAFTTDDVAIDVQAKWTSGVFRGVTKGVSSGFSTNSLANHLRTDIKDGYHDAPDLYFTHVPNWGGKSSIKGDRSGGWVMPGLVGASPQPLWDAPTPVETSSGFFFKAPPAITRKGELDWSLGLPLSRGGWFSYFSPVRKELNHLLPHDLGLPVGASYGTAYGIATLLRSHYFLFPWEKANPHTWIWDGHKYPPPPPLPPYVPDPNLKFYQRMEDYTGGAILVFGYPCYAWPLRFIPHNPDVPSVSPGVAIVIHNLTVTRVLDDVVVPVTAVSLRFDIDSWAWSVSLTLKGPDSIGLVAPTAGEPVQVLVGLDGVYIRAMIDGSSEDRRHGEITYYATGKSPLALMSKPFAFAKSFTSSSDMTAAQLIDLELLNTGWSAIYHPSLVQLFTTDWVVPAGAWSYQNQTPVEAIVTVAKAVGARAYSDREHPLVHIVPRYPVSPWNWATTTPDAQIPLWLSKSISTQLDPKPPYNHVYVSGENQGVLVSATRQGTAGDYPAPMVTDPLITFVGAGQEAARNILCDVGRQASVSVQLPMNASTGLVEPGQIVKVLEPTPWYGLATGVEVMATHGIITQTVTLERHFL